MYAAPTCALPPVRFAEPSAALAGPCVPSFSANWPLLPAQGAGPVYAEDVSYFTTKFCSLLEHLVAQGEWQAWLLLEGTTSHVQRVLGHWPRQCQRCSSRDPCYNVPEAKVGLLCPAHAQADMVNVCSSAGEPTWLLVWHTRQWSTVHRQRTTLRKLWESCKWCPAHTPDFLCMFAEGTLQEAQATVRPLDALFVGRTRLSLTAASAPAASPLKDTLTLEDVETVGEQLSSEHSRALALFPCLARADLAVLIQASAIVTSLEAAIPKEDFEELIASVQGDKMVESRPTPCLHLRVALDAGFCAGCAAPKAAPCILCDVVLCGPCARSSWWHVGHASPRAPSPPLTITEPGHVSWREEDGPCLPTLCSACAEEGGARTYVVHTAQLVLCSRCAICVHNLQILQALLPTQTAVLDVSPSVEGKQPDRTCGPFFLRGALCPPSVEALAVASRRLNLHTHAHRDWLADLLMVHIADLLGHRQQRVSAMEGGGLGPGSFGTSFLRREFVTLVVDTLHVLRGQHCWTANEIKVDAVVEIVTVVLRSLLSPKFAREDCVGRRLKTDWVEVLCREVLSDRHALRYVLACPRCEMQPNTALLFEAWRSAPVASGSLYHMSFACRHVAALRSPAERCLNSECPGKRDTQNYQPSTTLSGNCAKRRLVLTRCRHCGFPRSFGRTVFRMRDLVESGLRQEQCGLVGLLALPSDATMM
jgi:hypothetical protein